MTFPCASFMVAESELVVPTIIAAVDGATVTVVTAPDGVGVGSVVVPPVPEHTQRVGTRRSHHWRARRFARADMYDISWSLRPGLRLVREPPGNKMPPRHRQFLSDSLAARLALRKIAIAPWLCAAVFRRLCSEQRTYRGSCQLQHASVDCFWCSTYETRKSGLP